MISILKIISDVIQLVDSFLPLIGIVITTIVAVIGIVLASYFAKWQVEHPRKQHFYVLLEYYIAEIDYNKKIISRMKSYVFENPKLRSIWLPANTLSNYIKNEAWDLFAQNGLLHYFYKDDFDTIVIYNRSILDVRMLVQEFASNYARIYEWEEHDKKTNNPQPTNVKSFMQGAVRELYSAIEYSVENIDELEEMLEKYKKKYKGLYFRAPDLN